MFYFRTADFFDGADFLREARFGSLRASLTALPARNRTALLAAILNGLPALWIPPLACGPCRHIESAEAGDTDRLSSHERVENGVYDRLHRLPRRRLV